MTATPIPTLLATAPNTAIQALCDRVRQKSGVAECDRLAAALCTIRGRTRALGRGTGAYCIFSSELGHVQFMADTTGAEFLCEIQSHHFYVPVERRLTDAAVILISDSGFVWPVGKQNFARWFSVDTEADVDALAQFSLGVLNEIFGHAAGSPVSVTVHVPG